MIVCAFVCVCVCLFVWLIRCCFVVREFACVFVYLVGCLFACVCVLVVCARLFVWWRVRLRCCVSECVRA